MKVFINGMGNISPQKTWEGGALPEFLDYTGNKLRCVEPDYSIFIDPKHLRRMSRVIRMGVASAFMALKEAEVPMPDGIITSTGYGCLDDTGIFLNKMVDNREEALNPTPFIQSTHNTIGSQVALLLQCQSYNQTYTHGAFSFESALLDAMMQLSDSPERSFLVGGIDEITETSHSIQSRFGIFRKQVPSSLRMFESSQTGTINGEGSAFFVLSGNKLKGTMASINAVATFYKPDQNELSDRVNEFLNQESCKNIDLVLVGKSGDVKYDALLDKITDQLFPDSSLGVFKNLCGEYPVATAFACWLGARILSDKMVPEFVLQRDKGKVVKNILVFNQYFGTHYSLISLSAC